MNEFLFLAEDAHGRKQQGLAAELHEAYHNELHAARIEAVQGRAEVHALRQQANAAFQNLRQHEDAQSAALTNARHNMQREAQEAIDDATERASATVAQDRAKVGHLEEANYVANWASGT